jgi:predicted ATPase/class 3 adenylate cyclase
MRDLPIGTVSLLFTDIEGSTRLLEQVGERYAEMLEECRQLLRAAFQQWHGHEVDTQGDAFFVAFARASETVAAAVAAQRALASHRWPEGVAVRVRMGIHTGEPTLSAENYIGLDVHHAARIMSAGHGGQVLLSQTTRDLVEHDLPDDVSLRDLGAHRLKDLQQKSHLFQLVIAGLPADFPPLKTLDTHPNNLPVQLTSLIGRGLELATVQRLLSREDVRLLTLIGPGGTGKTRLGLQVAAELSDRFVDGVFFVNLAPLSDPALVVPTIAHTLDVKETGHQSLLDLLKVSLRDKHLLLLLDNFEQVISAASQVTELLAACPNLKIVVTSRAVLHVRGEQEFAVPPLAVPDPKHVPDLVTLSQYEAVALFIARAQAVKPEFQVTNANAPAVAEICTRLDGLPLAIELAAVRIKLLPPQALLARLGQRLAVLTGGARDVPARQQTLRNTIEWSYHLLDAQEQRLFRRLSVFVGGCTLQAVEAVCEELGAGSGKVFDAVASLIEKSLLQQTELEGEEPRLRMLETIREYALEALAATRELEVTQQAHAAYYLSLAERAEAELEGPRQIRWLERLEREHDNLRAALQWSLERVGDEEAKADQEMALRLAGAMWLFWYAHGHLDEGRALLERVLAGSQGTAGSMRAKALQGALFLSTKQGDYDQAEALAEEIRALGDTPLLAFSLDDLGGLAWLRGNLAKAHSLFEQGLAAAREKGDRVAIATGLDYMGRLAGSKGEYARARTLFEEGLTLLREVGNIGELAIVSFRFAEVLFVSQGDPVLVNSLLAESLALAQELSHKGTRASALRIAGQVALSQGDAAKARERAEESLTLLRETGEWMYVADTLCLLASVEAHQGDHAEALAHYQESLAEARQMGNRLVIAPSLEGLAAVVAAQGEFTWAARLWGAAESLREALGTPLPPVDRAGYERSFAPARISLGEKAFAAAWAEGRSMTLDQVLTALAPTERRPR